MQVLKLVIIFTRPKHSILRSYINWRFVVVAALLIKAKYQQWKTDNKNTGLFINCMDFVVERTKINKKKIVIFIRTGFITTGFLRNIPTLSCLRLRTDRTRTDLSIYRLSVPYKDRWEPLLQQKLQHFLKAFALTLKSFPKLNELIWSLIEEFWIVRAPEKYKQEFFEYFKNTNFWIEMEGWSKDI
jgi:hypothetical protein